MPQDVQWVAQGLGTTPSEVTTVLVIMFLQLGILSRTLENGSAAAKSHLKTLNQILQGYKKC